jgi:hypothetical protein
VFTLERIRGKRASVADYYRRGRCNDLSYPARYAFQGAKHLVTLDRLEDQADIVWSDGYSDLIMAYQFDGFTVRIYVDNETYDWGDLDPTEEERANLGVVGVGVRLDGTDIDLDVIWGIGYLADRSEPEREGLSTAVEYGFIDSAREAIERKRQIAIVRGDN